ncbi:hydrolase Nlp/P60 [Gordonia paraffinivorans]|uniref:C40 family peptidase n=2 Tax=Gordonia paraffinivorans TaxID=175628 RepID=UPI001C92E9DC|nr:NlpC/P60 family protein [Gordonia paraffinivorans]MBY4575339.1 hydrolase Nlp/P60 [Gordonia paraffinivorans]
MSVLRTRTRRVTCAVALSAALSVGVPFIGTPFTDTGQAAAAGSSSGSSSGSSDTTGSVPIHLPIPTPEGITALGAAMTQIGKPYRWGGTGPHSWDCSGLVQWAFSVAGVKLPRTSQQQAKVGHAIPFYALAPGDIIIFRRDAGHVGIYAGGGRVFNAYGTGVPVGFTKLKDFGYIKTIRRLG